MAEKRGSGLGTLILLNALLLGALWLFSIWAFPNLPDRYPVHFDFQGTPNRWAAGSSKEWFLVPGIATFLNAVFIATAASLRMIPVQLINLPNKERFLKLPRDRQLFVLDKVGQMTLGIALIPNVTLFAVQAMVYFVALGSMKMLHPALIMPLPALIVVVLIAWSVHIARVIRRETQAAPTSAPS